MGVPLLPRPIVRAVCVGVGFSSLAQLGLLRADRVYPYLRYLNTLLWPALALCDAPARAARLVFWQRPADGPTRSLTLF